MGEDLSAAVEGRGVLVGGLEADFDNVWVLAGLGRGCAWLWGVRWVR